MPTEVGSKEAENIRPVLLDATDHRAHIRRKALEGLTAAFPVKSRNFTIDLTNPRIQEESFSSKDQKKAILEARTLHERVVGDLVVKDTAGTVISSVKAFTLMHLPYFTQRHTFIIDGNEYNVSNQIRTKPGVYTRKRGNEDLEAAFNLAKGDNFRIAMDPEEGVLRLEHKTTKIPLYPILRALGVPHTDIANQWGAKVADVNKEATERNPEKHVQKLYDKLGYWINPKGEPPAATHEERVRQLHKYYNDTTRIDAEVTKRTLGQPFDHVTPLALLVASKKLLDVHRGGMDVDDRDSLEFKTFHGVDDSIKERIGLDAKALKAKIAIKLEAAHGDLRRAVPASPFSRGVLTFLSTSKRSQKPEQINPMELMDQMCKVTPLGEGGIDNERAIPMEARLLHPTHFGIMDPSRTPETFKTGIDIRTALDTHRDDKGNLYTPLRNIKTGKSEFLRPSEVTEAVVAFPTETIEANKTVSAMKNGKIVEVPSSEVTHQIFHVANLFGPTSNLLPFLNGMQGNRIVMASKHQSQALPLVYREPPHVQVKSWRPGMTVEKEMALKIVPTAPVDGTIEKIDDDWIYLRPSTNKESSADSLMPTNVTGEYVYNDHLDKLATDADGLIRIHYDNHFPLAAKTFLHNTIKVKPGDTVKAGQTLAESNFTKDDTLCLGKNMSVAYMAYRGLNSNDGIVISQGAADKLVSEHMYREDLRRDSDLINDKERHRTYFGMKYTAKQYDNLDSEGVVKPGTKLEPGDPVIVALRKGQVTGDAALLGKLSRSLVTPFKEEIKDWHHETPGEVIDVVKTPHIISVTIKTWETINVGDKLCFDEETEVLTDKGWKPVAAVTVGDRVCTLVNDNICYEQPTAIHKYPTGGRMYYIRSQQVDQLVTEEHNMYVKPRGEKTFRLIPAKSLKGKRVRYKKDGKWRGKDPKYFIFPALMVNAGQFGNGEREIPERRMPIETFLMLLGAYLSEGNIINHVSSGSYGIDICQVKEPNRSYFITALNNAQIDYCFSGDKIRIHSKQLMLYFKQFGLSGDKFIPEEIFDLSPRLLNILFKWLMWGDGHTEKYPISYSSISKELADGIQRLCLHIGKAANIQIACEAGPQTIRGHVYDCKRCYSVRIINKKLTPQVNHGHVKKQHVQEEGFIENYEKPVFCVTVPNHVLYVRRNGKSCWSGNSGRFGNKGVIAKIIPDEQMIKDEKGKPIEVLLTSAGIISRVNPGQILEAAVGKVAEHTGEPIAIENFANHDNLQYVKDLLKKHGLKDKETVYDPITKKSIPGVFVGSSYIIKLFKSTYTNWAAHGSEKYDVNQQPSRGGDEGAKGIGKMEFDGLVAHNARNILRESATVKSQKNDEYWRAIQLGLPVPSPQTTFAYDKFLTMLEGAGIKVNKDGQKLTLAPLTDADIEKVSSGKIENAYRIKAKNLMPEKGGLFDPVLTGGLIGTKWSHIELQEPIVNPVFEEPVRRLLGLTQKQFEDLHAQQGGAYFKKALADIDVDKKIEDLKKQTKTLRGAALDSAVKQVKYLTALKANNLTPDKAYVLHKIPVVPPIMRQIVPLKDGRLLTQPVNLLYTDAFLANKGLKDNIEAGLPQSELATIRTHLYKTVGAVFGTEEPQSPTAKKRNAQGFILQITGARPKNGFFQSKLMSRMQDVSGRATIAPDPTLDMDEIGMPEDMLWKMYSKFIVGRLVRKGYPAIDAQRMVNEHHPFAKQELMLEAQERPVFVNRAPSLHRYSIIGAYPKLTSGKTIRLNPFAERGMNADYDGDAIQVHAPVTAGGIQDVKNMTLSKLIFSDKKSDPLNVAPDMEAVIGLHRATQPMTNKETKNFDSRGDALAAYHRGEINLSDPIDVKEKP